MDDQPSLDSLLAHQPLIQSGPFISGIVHDINNGIGAVIAYAELIGMGTHSSRDLDEMLDDLMSAAKRIADLNEALSTFTRQEPPKRTFASVAKIVEQLVIMCEYRFRSRGVRLNVSLEGDLDQSVKCYKNALARAALYLLLNALENAEDAPRKEALLSARIDPEGVTIGVRDHGPAMTPDQFERYLKPYATTKSPPHLGLGLPAAEAVAKAHGGELRYSAESGVTLRIPHQRD